MATTLLIPSSCSASFLSKGTTRFRNYALSRKCHVKSFRVRAVKEKTDELKNPSQPSSSAEEITKKYGLEAGLWKIFSSKDEGNGDPERKKSKGDEAKELLAKYGGAYLATSITLSLISFALCYALISAGIDVQALLHKVGISIDETGERVGTFALAYAAHKAASPIRFPPTVALTPIVAGWIGKKVDKDK
ncbi:protein FAM210B, mitochondrial-like [Neltuma alba]|uniref:protein FAM210B, mitochondrial-like n=1 Tax=Neltuma alba TaxID=207710 RepID=UPI0010A310B9|nr:protein FAM210B, mitochondrial-like [Prosopis alba]XP_028767293.1 protein FAM210B, mitochondrial-like [Prosopis alba]XP_028783209.1 protein FAM210B, mitochondrial-like [Prosopis alba]